MSNKEHWENIYTTKTPKDVSWTEAIPSVSINLIELCDVSKDASIIDVGGGDSLLADYLLKQGYTNVSVLDISSAAIKRAKTRLGMEADRVTWIVSDITNFKPKQKYDVVVSNPPYVDEEDINSLEESIQGEIAELLPEFRRWFLGKDFPPRRSGGFAQALCAWADLPLPLCSIRHGAEQSIRVRRLVLCLRPKT